MSLWSTVDSNVGAPKFAVAGGLGVSANGNVLFDNVTVGAFKTGIALGVFGVSAAEASNTVKEGANTTHAGWVLRTQGTGFVKEVQVTDGGAGYTPSEVGFITFGNQGSGVGANATYYVNATGNVDNVVINYVGNTYNTTAVTANAATAYSVAASFTVVMGGRAGRISYETIVASGNIAADAGADDAIMGA